MILHQTLFFPTLTQKEDYISKYNVYAYVYVHTYVAYLTLNVFIVISNIHYCDSSVLFANTELSIIIFGQTENTSLGIYDG